MEPPINRAHQSGARGKMRFEIFDFEQVRHIELLV